MNGRALYGNGMGGLSGRAHSEGCDVLLAGGSGCMLWHVMVGVGDKNGQRKVLNFGAVFSKVSRY